MANRYIPVTPAGTPLVELEAKTELNSWKNLHAATAHIYPSVQALKKRGYTVERVAILTTIDHLLYALCVRNLCSLTF